MQWADRLGKIDTRAEVVEDDGGFDGKNISTPTVVVIRDGEFADAKSGAQGLSGGMTIRLIFLCFYFIKYYQQNMRLFLKIQSSYVLYSVITR